MQPHYSLEHEEVREVIRRCIDALRQWDRAAMARIFADDPRAIHYGTAADEKYIGGAAYLQAMERQHTVTIPDVEFDFLPGSPAIETQDGIAWVVGDARLSGTSPTRHYFQIDTRITFILRKQDDRWQIVHSHFSIPVQVS
jgi:ketosteroid isomerase-like protein